MRGFISFFFLQDVASAHIRLHALTSPTLLRICPGRFLGEPSVFVGIATLLHVLRFNKAKDENGDEITVNPEDAEYISGTARCVAGVIHSSL